MKFFLYLLIFVGNTAVATPSWRQMDCIRALGSVATDIPRVGQKTYNASGVYESVGEGVFEFEIDKVLPLHPVPNPRRYPEAHPPGFESELATRIKSQGYILGPAQKGQPIVVLLMPDSQLYCGGGHHRRKAMKDLGAKFIPGVLFEWDKLAPESQAFYCAFLPQNYCTI